MFLFKYQYCGPGTKLKKRLERGDQGVNELDKACKEHDIAYFQNSGDVQRREADNILANKAWKRFKSSEAKFGERATALAVAGIMKAKSKLGFGLKAMSKTRTISKEKVKKKENKATTRKELRNTIQAAKKAISIEKPISVETATKMAINAATAAVKKQRISQKDWTDNAPRVIPVPKIGGILPLVPIFAGLSALGALMGGSASVANAVMSAKNAKEKLMESDRHNKVMEAIAIGKNKRGNGVFLKPYRKGLGVYLNHKSSKNL